MAVAQGQSCEAAWLSTDRLVLGREGYSGSFIQLLVWGGVWRPVRPEVSPRNPSPALPPLQLLPTCWGPKNSPPSKRADNSWEGEGHRGQAGG